MLTGLHRRAWVSRPRMSACPRFRPLPPSPAQPRSLHRPGCPWRWRGWSTCPPGPPRCRTPQSCAFRGCNHIDNGSGTSASSKLFFTSPAPRSYGHSDLCDLLLILSSRCVVSVKTASPSGLQNPLETDNPCLIQTLVLLAHAVVRNFWVW